MASDELEHRDCQMTIVWKDGSEFTWTVLRDHDMRWIGDGSLPMISFRCEWFDNPPHQTQEAPQ